MTSTILLSNASGHDPAIQSLLSDVVVSPLSYGCLLDRIVQPRWTTNS